MAERGAMTGAARPDAGRTVSAQPAVSDWAVISAGLTPVLLAAAWLAAGALQPASYSPVRQTVSVLAGYGGTDRWIVTRALFLAGGFYFVTAAGLSGVGGPGAPLARRRGPVQYRHRRISGARGRLHSAACRLGRARRGHHRDLARVCRPALAVTAADPECLRHRPGDGPVRGPARLARHRNPGRQRPGLAERLTSGIQTSWPFIVAIALRRATSPGAPAAAEAISLTKNNARRRARAGG